MTGVGSHGLQTRGLVGGRLITFLVGYFRRRSALLPVSRHQRLLRQ